MLNIIWNRKTVKKFKKGWMESIEGALSSIEKARVFDTTPKRLRDIVKDSKGDDSFLIIGGHKLFPFYEVRNPTNDRDRVVWTDNLYGSTDDDPLLPERSIGRLPDGGDLGFLLKKIRSIEEFLDNDTFIDTTFGLSAAVWEDASRNIYKIISDRELLLSPPENTKTIKIGEDVDIFYFNLHGSDKSNKWYGQADGRYPIALSPDNIPGLNNAVVFTEACYGAYTIDKGISDSIALTFLKNGVQCFIGSTTVAYGPPIPPPTEADLLTTLFFEKILRGNKFGISLLNAKQEFFRKMMNEQGFLDGDDKKTLLQFVLYGNPEGRFLAKNAKD
ncbi:hypothetical protein KAW48_03860, partial [candidate division WOR-3 bacterium]|nr:hypothetical protein [candidate division WOR-3 bacterium]